MSLRAKVVLALVLLTSAATVAIGISTYVSTRRLLDDQVNQSLADSVSSVVAQGGRGGAHPEPDGDRNVDTTRVSDQNVTQYIGGDGNRLTGGSNLVLPIDDVDRAVAKGTIASVRHDTSVDGVDYRVLTVRAPNGLGAVQAGRSLAENERVLDSLRNITLLATLCVMAAAAAIGWFIARQVTRRLARLTGVAETVAATGRLDVDVPIGGKDEAGRLGSAFNEMLAALGRSRDAQQRLVQDAGHELRTPLTSLRTNVSVLRRHDELPQATRAKVLDDLEIETRELTGLVDELVELATDSRDDEPDQIVVLGPLAERVAQRTTRRTGRQVLVSGDRSTVIGRPQALERALSNLVDNAAKFDPGTEPIRVQIADGRVEVADRGPGIPEGDLPHVFDRFYRAVGARSRPGSGLGLAIVRDIVESHGGTVFAANQPAGGAVVGFTLPVVT